MGEIRNAQTGNILQGGLDKNGYRQVILCYNHKQYCRRVCRLVAIAFINNPNNLPVVNHKNENKLDDRCDNLEWCTIEYNNNYGTRLNTLRKKVQCIETNVIYDGLRIAQKETGIDRKNISKACHQNTLAGGYHWRFYK